MDELQTELLNKVEAVLFATGRDMDAQEIAKIVGIGSIGAIKDALTELCTQYNARNTALQLYEENGKYKLNIKKSYNYLTTKLITDCELDFPTQETLAIIAYKQPIFQADIIKSRGNGAYDHIHMLKEKGLVTSEKSGRTRKLQLTQKFYDYFDVVEDQLKAKFQEIEQKVGIVEEKQETLPVGIPEENAHEPENAQPQEMKSELTEESGEGKEHETGA